MLEKICEKLMLEKICEKLPLDITIFEEDGRCERKTEKCAYCKKHSDEYFCYKKSYTILRKPVLKY